MIPLRLSRRFSLLIQAGIFLLPAACQSPAKPSAAPGGHEHGPLGHRFESADEWAKRFEAPDRAAWQRPEEVVQHLALSPGMTVADLGAGTGYFLPYLSRAVGAGGKVLGLDIELDMVRYMKERITREKLENVQAVQVSVGDPGLALSSVDRILVVDTWHHIPDRPAYVRKLAEALRPGGAVCVVDFTLETERGPPRDHRVSAESVLADLKSGGLDARLLADEQLPDQYIVIGERRKL